MTQEIIEPGKAYTTTQAGYFLGFTENYIRRLIRHGRIIATKPMGGHHRITGEEVLRILDGIEGGGRVPPNQANQSADVIYVTDEQAAKIFHNTPAAGADISPPTQSADEEEDDGSIYQLMRRKYGD